MTGLLRMPPGLGENVPGSLLPIAPLVRRLADRLDETGIEWAVLRNAEELPEFTRYDLDILTLPRHRDTFIRLVEGCAAETGWRMVGRIRKRHYTCLMLVRGSGAEERFFLPLDIFTALEFRGLRYLDAESVLGSRIRMASGLWTVPPGVDAAITLLKELLPHGVLKENSRATVQAQAAEDPERFRSSLETAVGADLARRLTESVRCGEWNWAPAEAKAIRHAVRKRTSGWLLAVADAGLQSIAHLFRPSLGMVVCLAGADGSGKTTLASGLAVSMFKHPFKACRYVHGNIGVLPRFRDMRAFLLRWVRRGPLVPAPVDEPQALKGMMEPIPAWKSMALATYYAVDLQLARLLLPRWRGQWTLLLMDRSFYDYYYQLGHRRCPQWYLHMLASLVPKPDLLLCIVGDATCIHVRKPELTVAEIQAEQAILERLITRFAFGCRLDGHAGIKAMVEAGRRAILQALPDGEAGGLRCWRMLGRPLVAHLAAAPDRGYRALDLFPRATVRRAGIHRAIRSLLAARLERWASVRRDSAVEWLSSSDLESLIDAARRAGGGADVEWLLTWPACPARKRLYLVFRAHGASTVGVVKIGAGVFNVHQLRNEARVLESLPSKPHPFSIPAFRFLRDLSRDRVALVLGEFPVQSRPVPAAKAAMFAQEVAEHFREAMPVSRLRMGAADWFQGFRGRDWTGVGPGRLLAMEDREIDVGFAHGDLGPGNMLDNGMGGVFLFDWENASLQAPVLVDSVGFWLACRQRKTLGAPGRLAAEMSAHFSGSSEMDLLAVLGFLCAHENLAAIRVLEAWE